MASADMATQLGSKDRMVFALFMAVAMHGLIVLGLSSNPIEQSPRLPSLDLVLVQEELPDSPDKPDDQGEAMLNQLGEIPPEMTTPNTAQDDQVDAVSVQASQDHAADTTPATIMPASEELATKPSGRDLMSSALKMAGLQAKINQHRQENRPRVRRLSSLTALTSAEANYLNSWRRKVERIGNLNYPQEARQRKIYGSLRLLVALLPDGSIKEIELLESSGHAMLDEAAIRIVRLSAPFAPFPDDLRESLDELEIIRTWQFRKNSSFWGG